MKFTPGTSGNPAGRPRGPRAPSEAKLRADILQKAPEIVAALFEQAAHGDVGASKILLDRALPPLRAVDLPTPVVIGDDLASAPRAVLSAIASGSLTLDEAAKLAAVIANLSRSVESLEFETRLAALEADRALS